MNTWGWIFMLTSLAIVWITTIWAYIRLLSAAPQQSDAQDLTR